MHQLAKPIRQIASSLDSLRDFVDVLDTFLGEQRDKSLRANADFFAPLLVAMSSPQVPETLRISPLNKLAAASIRAKYPVDEVKITETEDGIQIQLPLTKKIDIQNVISEVLAQHKRTQMLYSSALLNLTSSVELFFARLLHEYFGLQPDAIGTKDKVFSFEDLSRFDTIADARSHYVLDRIENLLRGSLADWLKFARDQVKLSMGYLKDDLALLEESFQRRNLIVHNGGIVNSLYMSRVSPDARQGVAMGADISPSRQYLNATIDMWERSCILIAAELWKRLDDSDSDRAAVLGEISYDHLTDKRWSISEALSEFLVRDKALPEASRLNAQLNLWQCQKRLGKWTSVEASVAAFDIGAKSPRYQLPVLALLEKHDEFFELLPRAVRSGELTKTELKEWPIFADVRDDPRFKIATGRRVTAKKSATTKRQSKSGALKRKRSRDNG